MIPNPNSPAKHYGPQRARTLHSALAQRLGAEFPRLGGPRILDLCARMIMEIIDAHYPLRERCGHGQIIWNAIAIEERPYRGQSAAETLTRPVILTLNHPEDIADCIERPRDRSHWSALRLKRALRLSREAHEQGALLSNVDLSLMLTCADNTVATQLSDWEDQHAQIVPRRTTLHDVGTGVTHKRIICRKRHLEGKDPSQVARETWHSLEAVDRYLGQYDRVRHCRQQGMNEAQSAHILNCTPGLVKEYLQIDDEINHARQSNGLQNPAASVATDVLTNPKPSLP